MYITESTEGDEDCGGDFSDNWRKMCLEDDSEKQISELKSSSIDNEEISVNLNQIFSNCITKTPIYQDNDELKLKY